MYILIESYFEASPNHDAVAWRIVNDTLAEEIMVCIRNYISSSTEAFTISPL